VTTRDEVYAVLISLSGDTLLLPNAAVAEVVSPDRMEVSGPGAQPWLAGRVPYGGHRLPVLRFEVLNGSGRPEASRRTRIAIVNAITGTVLNGQYGLLCQGYPHLVTLSRSALRNEQRSSSDNENLVLTRVGIANTSALIPNLEALEARIAEAQLAQAASAA
jgi:chemosensory pili system protein ChpC